MRDEIAKAHLGRKVDWALTFTDGSTDDSGRAHLLFHFDPRTVRIVTGEVPLSKYPRLRSMRAGEPLRVRGTIRKITLFNQLQPWVAVVLS